MQHAGVAARGEVGQIAPDVPDDADAEVRAACAAALLVNPLSPSPRPAVSPKAIRRWTSRKKMTTGIAVSVDAAISAPQSVLRLVPRK